MTTYATGTENSCIAAPRLCVPPGHDAGGAGPVSLGHEVPSAPGHRTSGPLALPASPGRETWASLLRREAGRDRLHSLLPHTTTTSWSSGRASAARSPPCAWPRRATGSGCSRRGGGSTTTTSPRRPGTSGSYLWAPQLGCFGIQRIHLLRDVVVLAGAGVGGGSLDYANTLTGRRRVLRRPAVGATSPTGGAELAPHYDRPSGCSAWSTNPTMTPGRTEVMQAVADGDGRGRTPSA